MKYQIQNNFYLNDNKVTKYTVSLFLFVCLFVFCLYFFHLALVQKLQKLATVFSKKQALLTVH